MLHEVTVSIIVQTTDEFQRNLNFSMSEPGRRLLSHKDVVEDIVAAAIGTMFFETPEMVNFSIVETKEI